VGAQAAVDDHIVEAQHETPENRRVDALDELDLLAGSTFNPRDDLGLRWSFWKARSCRAWKR
jgi:hypothetical protein